MLHKSIVGLVLCLTTACQDRNAPLDEGRQLAQVHCSSCHSFPEPTLLDQATWKEKVLPQMGLRMGIAPDNTQDPPIQQAFYYLTEADLYPRPALISLEEWEKICQFYDSLAPDSLVTVTDSLPLTSLFAIHRPDSTLPPAVTYVHFHQKTQEMLVANHAQGQIMTINSQQNATSLLNYYKLVSYVQELPNPDTASSRLLITYLGKDIRPGQAPAGEITEVTFRRDEPPRATSLDLPPLPRPTQALYVDLVGDSLPELLTCNFGYLEGRLSYWTPSDDGPYTEHIIKNEPGALRAITQDFTRDGRIDLLVLWGQGDERLSLYENKGDGRFTERVLLRFPPSYGSSYFELADVDQDGTSEIVYTCGDNADYSPIPKPYHGVYIFKDQGDFHYQQVYFYPMDGAYKALARDFDRDGDVDITAVAFFTGDTPRQEGWVYLEQQPDFQFHASTVPIHPLGRWITLDAGDLDQDGDLDIMLGNCATAMNTDRTVDQQWRKGPPYLILENTTF